MGETMTRNFFCTNLLILNYKLRHSDSYTQHTRTYGYPYAYSTTIMHTIYMHAKSTLGSLTICTGRCFRPIEHSTVPCVFTSDITDYDTSLIAGSGQITRYSIHLERVRGEGGERERERESTDCVLL